MKCTNIRVITKRQCGGHAVVVLKRPDRKRHGQDRKFCQRCWDEWKQHNPGRVAL